MKDIVLRSLSPRKQEILEAACQLISREGYPAASMRVLAKELDIKPASLYSHYENKDEILWEIAIRSAKAFHEEVLPIAQLDLPIADRLDRMIRAHVHLIIANIDASAIFFLEWKHLTEDRKKEYAAAVAHYEAGFTKLLNAGVESGIFRPMKTKFVTSSLISSINWIHKWYKPDGQMSVEEIAAQASDFILKGLIV